MGKYTPLTVELERAAASGLTTFLMTFDEVGLLVDGLPASAFVHRAWWSNDSKVEAQAWREAGWHVEWVSLDQRRVRFELGKVGGSYAARRAGARSH